MYVFWYLKMITDYSRGTSQMLHVSDFEGYHRMYIFQCFAKFRVCQAKYATWLNFSCTDCDNGNKLFWFRFCRQRCSKHT